MKGRMTGEEKPMKQTKFRGEKKKKAGRADMEQREKLPESRGFGKFATG